MQILRITASCPVQNKFHTQNRSLNTKVNDSATSFVKPYTDLAFQGVIKYANTLRINPFKEYQKPATKEIMENYIRDGMFIHMPHIGNRKFGEVFLDEFRKLFNIYRKSPQKYSAEQIYNILERKAEQLSSKHILNLAAQKQVFGRAEAISKAAKRILEQNNIKLNQDAVYLDIGSGDGTLTQKITDVLGFRNKNVHGLEIDIRNDKTCINRTYFDGQNIPSSMPKSDFVTIFNVLHHTKSDIEAKNLLKSIYKNLNKGGKVLIRDHNAEDKHDINYWQIRHLLPIRVSKVDPPCLSSDMVYHSEKDWVKILEKTGFKKIYSENDKIGDNSKYSFYMLLEK